MTWNLAHPGGQIAWEIGIPDRSAAEFKHGTNYWYPFLWDQYCAELSNPLEFTIGSNAWATAWNYAHSGYELGVGSTNWAPWKWRIHFTLTNLPTSGTATLTLALASMDYGAVDVYVNDETTLAGEVAFAFPGGGAGGNALVREGIHAKYGLGYQAVPLSSLRLGTNTITLVERSVNWAFDHVMYDYLNLELPATVVLPPGRNLNWRGGNAAHAWDQVTTTNWILSSNSLAAAFTNGDNVLFDDTGAPNLTANLNSLMQPGSVTVNATANYTFNGAAGVGSLNGPMSLIKTGTGALTVNNTNGFGGPVLLSQGKIVLGTSGALGSGILQLAGGTIQLNSGGTLANAVNVLAPSTVATSGNSYLNGAISGNANLTVASGNVLSFQASVANFPGTVSMGNSSGYLRFNQSGVQGVPNGTVDAGTNTATIETRLVGGGTIYLGALSGGANTRLRASDQTSYPGSLETYVIGALNTDSTFAGSIQDSAHVVGITKVGAGTWTLTGASAYSGPTQVGGGTLQVAGSLTTTNFVIVSNTATLDLSGSVTADTVQVNAGGSLTGCGAIQGDLVNNGTIISACGKGHTLAIVGNVTNNGAMQILSGTSLAVTGTLVNYGLLDLLTAAQTLPPNLVNYGTVLMATNTCIRSWSYAGGVISLTLQGYDGHSYQLQRTASLASANWQNTGPSQDGLNAPLTFTDSAPGSPSFYRLLIAP